jgi:hypothetical protein
MKNANIQHQDHSLEYAAPRKKSRWWLWLLIFFLGAAVGFLFDSRAGQFASPPWGRGRRAPAGEGGAN